MDFVGHWKLRERPFEATWDTRFFYGSPGHLEALNRLHYFITERTMNACLLSGEIGCGKTLTRSVFTANLDPVQFLVLTIENSGFSFAEIVESILNKIDPHSLEVCKSTMSRMERLGELLALIGAQGRHVVLILDEAQDMSASTLHDLRCLTNFNTGGRAFLSLVIIGQPEVRHHVVGNAAMDQRVSLRFHLGPLTQDDLPYYLAHRLRVAGHPSGAVFSREACIHLQSKSGGVPREVNRLAKLSMEHAWLKEQAFVDVENVQAVVEDLARHQTLVAA